MASLGDNPLWDKVANGDESADVLGPSYSYADHIQGPSELGVGNEGTMAQLGRNTQGITQYVKYMISGPALGDRYFVNTGGSCVAPDGSTQSRYNYINNVPDAAADLPDSMKKNFSGIASDFNGLVPGMIGDIAGLSPVSLFRSLAADSTPSCECYTCATTSTSESRFLNTKLTPDFNPDLCKQVDVSQCKPPAKESFRNRVDFTVPTLVALSGLVFLNLF